MNFGEAINAMKDGKRIRRKGWGTLWLASNNSEYIYLGIDNAAFDKGHPWTPSQTELMAEDWEIKPEPQKANNDRNGLLYLSLLMLFFALGDLRKEKDEYSPFNG